MATHFFATRRSAPSAPSAQSAPSADGKVTVWFVCNDSRRWVQPYVNAARRQLRAAKTNVGIIDLAAEKKANVLRKLQKGDILVNFLNPTRSYMHDSALLADIGSRGYVVINGSASAFELDASKLKTYEEMKKYGISTPKTLPLYKLDGMADQASRIYAHFHSRSGAKTKIVAKPNMGTEGKEVRVYNTIQEALQNLHRFASTSRISNDGVVLLQEHVRPVTDDFVYRAEFIDGKLLYVVAVNASKSQSLCPCQLTKGSNKLSPIKILLNRDLPVTQAKMNDFKGKCLRFMQDKDLDACSFEFAVRSGDIFVYDVNVLTTYNENAEKEAGNECPHGHVEYARMISKYVEA